MGTVVKPFDILDGSNEYRPCPKCHEPHGMGMITRNCRLAVECVLCGHRGPEIEEITDLSWERDKAAFDAWNSQA